MISILVVAAVLCGAVLAASSDVAGSPQKLLSNALDSVLGVRKEVSNSWVQNITAANGLPRTQIRIRCSGYLACGGSTPTIEISNPIIYNGKVYFNYPDQESMDTINRFPTFIAAVPNHLPSCLAEIPRAIDWVPGPAFAIIIETRRLDNQPTHCGEYLDDSAHFLFAWEPHNSFHAMNDNLFAVLTSLILQRYSQMGPSKDTKQTSLYIFDVSCS
jgi:hypothetical protein